MSIVAVNLQRLGYALAGGVAYYAWESASFAAAQRQGAGPFSFLVCSLTTTSCAPVFCFRPAPTPHAGARASRSYATFIREREEEKANLGPDVALERWLVERNRLVPPPQPLLAIDNFNIDNLEGTPAPPNSTSQDRRFSAR